MHLSNEGSLLELNEAVSDALSSGESVDLLAGASSLLLTVVLSEGVNSNLLSHVELVCDRGSSDVEPVWVVWREILIACGLIVSGPLLYIILN